MNSFSQKIVAAANAAQIAITLNASDNEAEARRAVKALSEDNMRRIERQLEVSGEAATAAEVHRMV